MDSADSENEQEFLDVDEFVDIPEERSTVNKLADKKLIQVSLITQE